MTITDWQQHCLECEKVMKDDGLWPRMVDGKTTYLGFRFICLNKACKDKLGYHPTKYFATEVPFTEIEKAIA